MSAADLLAHFRTRTSPQFFPGFTEIERTATLQHRVFPNETSRLIDEATAIVDRHCWSLLGFGEKCFGLPKIDWNRDPLSGFDWPRDYHADIKLIRRDGSDVRVLWELSRFAHSISLGRAYVLTNDPKFGTDFFGQLASWRAQNPVGRSVNWNCAMEVALRAMNLLAAFLLFRQAPQMNEDTLKEFLQIFDQHGGHIKRNLEFSHIATSNHYLTDVTGLLWLGLMLPELEAAREWRQFGLHELLNEMNKQVLPDGADYEASTGYHRLKVELFLYSFLLCRINNVDIGNYYWDKLHAMIDYLRVYLRPDGRAPIVGDSDSGQVFPIVKHTADDHSYILSLGAATFQERRFKTANAGINEELLWILGEQGLRDYERLTESELPTSRAFPDAGIYILREKDLYFLFKTGGIGVNGRGSHGHNDSLSIEVSACGMPFIVDPGTYVYTADLHQRHLFRSTAYHSTVEIDEIEQNSIEEATPFIIGDEARPRMLGWESGAEADVIVAEHYGYRRLKSPIIHRRTVRFNKRKRCWVISDDLRGEGSHSFRFRFHVAPGLETNMRADGMVEVCDKMKGARLLIAAGGFTVEPELESQFSSVDYGAKEPSVSICWTAKGVAPLAASFVLVPIAKNEEEAERLHLARFQINNQQSEISNR